MVAEGGRGYPVLRNHNITSYPCLEGSGYTLWKMQSSINPATTSVLLSRGIIIVLEGSEQLMKGSANVGMHVLL